MQGKQKEVAPPKPEPKSLPDLLDTLKAIDRVAGRHLDKKSQKAFLQTLLEKKHGRSVSEEVMAEVTRDFQKKLAQYVKTNAGSYVHAVHTKKYGIADFWEQGKNVLTNGFLQENEWDASSDEETDNDGDDVPEVSPRSTKPSSSESSRSSTERNDKAIPAATAESERGSPVSGTGKTVPEQVERKSAAHVQTQSMTAERRESTAEGTNGVREGSGTPVRLCGKRLAEDVEPPAEKKQRTSPEAREANPSIAQVVHDASIAVLASKDTHDASSETASPDDGREWALRAGLRELPAILPTKRPTIPQDIITDGDEAWLAPKMEALEDTLWKCMESFFQEHQIDAECSSTFVTPLSDLPLSQLYETLFGNPHWRLTVVNLALKGIFCRQDYTFMSLLGAGIYQAVFQSPLPWSIKNSQPFGKSRKYFDAVFTDLGHDIETVLKYVAGKQIADEEFQETVVKEYANQLAGNLATILLPHMKLLKKTTSEPESLGFKPWQEYLQKAFKMAVVIKRTLLVSKSAPVSCRWPAAGKQINGARHKPLFETEGAAKILHTVLPGFVTRPRNENIYIGKPVVIPLVGSGNEQ